MNKLFKNLTKELLGLVYFNIYKRYFSNHGNRTLIYHAFGSKLEHDTYGISINLDLFKSHMLYLKDNYSFHNITNSHKHNNSISITIDDGYKDTLDAVSILEDFKIPFDLFITSDFINKNGYLSENDIKEISLLKYSHIGSHGKTHTKLASLSRKKQKLELFESKKVIESIIGNIVNSISFPHGSYNEDTTLLLKEIGYEFAATSKKGFNTNKTNKLSMHRSEIIAYDKIKDLKKKVDGFYDYY